MTDIRYGRTSLPNQGDQTEDKRRFSWRSFLRDLFRALVLAAGISGILLLLHGFPDIEFDLNRTLGLVFIMFFSMVLLHHISGYLFSAAAIIGFVFYFRQGHRDLEQIIDQCNRIYDWFMGVVAVEPVDLTLLLTYSVILVTFAIFLLDVLLRYHLPTYLFITVAFLAPPFFGAQLGYRELILMGIFQFFFLADSKVGRGLGLGFLNNEKRSATALKTGLISVLLFGLAFLIALPVSERVEGRLFSTSLELEEKIADAIDASFSNDEGVINRGSNTHTGETLFRVEASREPGDSVFLIRYRGDEYDGSRWTPVNEDPFIEEVALSYETDERSVLGIYNTLYFQWNYVGVSGVDPNVRQLVISSRETKYVAMRPYFGIRPEALIQDVEGNYSAPYYYYEEGELTELPEDPERGWAGMSLFAQTYEEYARSKYMDYPERQLPRLKALVDETPLTDLDEITSFIIYTLGANAKYTTRPGLAPFNRDIVENFLFNSGLGYCQHYASTATLMYRMYGIPARYVTGFRLDPADFTPYGDSEELEDSEDPDEGPSFYGFTDIPDSAAHAWTEIYINGYGWVPVDVTPSSSGNFYPSYPGFTPERMREIQLAKGWILNPQDAVLEEEYPIALQNQPREEALPEEETLTENPASSQSEEDYTPPGSDSPQPFPDLVQDMPMEEESSPAERPPLISPEVMRKIGAFLLRLLIIALLLGSLSGLLILYRRISLRRNRNLNASESFLKLADLMRYCGCRLPERRDDPQLPKVISEFMTDERGYSPITLNQAERVISAVSAASFSARPSSEEEDIMVRDLYRECAEALYEKQPWLKKLIFRFIKVYI